MLARIYVVFNVFHIAFNTFNVVLSHFYVYQVITYLEEVHCCKCTEIYRKDEENCLMTKTINGCGEHQNNTIHLAVDIPPTIPTEILMSKNIKVTYSLRVNKITVYFSSGQFQN